MNKPETHAGTATLLAAVISATMLQSCAHYQPRGPESLSHDGHPPFTFLVIGDTRPGRPAYPDDPGTPSIDYLEQIHWINRLNPDFTVAVGDLIRGYNTKHPGLAEKQWDTFDETVSLYRNPLYMVVGNHDVWDEYSDEIYQRRYGPHYFSFDHKGCHFIALSGDIPDELNTIGPAQLEWLEQDLAASGNALCTFVFLHKPLWLEGYDENSIWMTEVHELLKKHDVDMVFAGHEHHYEPFLIDGIRYFITGGGGAEIGGRENLGDFFHFLSIAVPRRGEPSVEIIRKSKALDAYAIPIGLRQMVTGIERTLREQTAIVMGTDETRDISFSVKNSFNAPVELDIAWLLDEKGAVCVEPPERRLKLARGEEAEVSFKVASPRASSEIPKLKWTLTMTDRTLADGQIKAPVARSGRYSRSGVSSPEAGLRVREKQQVVVGHENWNGPEDCSATATVTKNEKGITVLIDVTDDVLQARTRTHYQNDSVELYFDLRSERRGEGGPYDKEGGVFQVIGVPCFSPTIPNSLYFGPFAEESEVPGATMISQVVEGTGYHVEIFLPYDGLTGNHPFPQGNFNFDLGINDADSSGARESQIMWSGSRDNWRTPLCFGRLTGE